jgi:polyketide synthase 12
MAGEQELRAYLRRATAELEDVRRRLEQSQSSQHDPIAIVGMACRFPGGIESPSDLWDAVAAGRDMTGPFPTDRGWPLEGLYDPTREKPRRSYVDRGGFIQGAGDFDPLFFGISPREAVSVDPQQRWALVTAWEAIERAGIDPVTLRGADVGLFLGVVAGDYVSRAIGSEEIDPGYLMLGATGSVASGRVSYALGLEGPAVSVDTACSSSLVAIHLACQSLRTGESVLALAGGITVMATPGIFVGFSQQQALAADGRCKAYAKAADGFGIAEGAGMLLLERLEDARNNGHPVVGLIRGSAVNQDGASNGLVAPNGLAQRKVIRAALQNARLEPADVSVVEGHGTGTALGDPIEAEALLDTYGQKRAQDKPLLLGTVKSNIGHTQAAAGVAGVIKMVEAMRHGHLPATLHVDEPTPHVDWTSGNVELITEARPWSDDGSPRRAGVSSFGISGTNAHVIVEQAFETPGPVVDTGAQTGAQTGADGRAAPGEQVVPWVISARSSEALHVLAGRLDSALEDEWPPEADIADVGRSLLKTRSLFENRAVVIGRDRAQLMSGVAAVAAGVDDPRVVVGRATMKGKVAFVFPGQGAQWAGMAVQLMDSSPVFATEMDACDKAFAAFVDWSVIDVLRAPGSASLERVDVVQPTLFAVMVSLAAMWRSFGVEPDGIIGHSQGEIAAAYLAGALSLTDAARAITLRSKALTAIADTGGMVWMAASTQRVRELLAPWSDRVGVAAMNGPSATVVSGEPGALDEVMKICEDQGIRTNRLPVNYAAHSAQVEPLRDELERELDCIEPRDCHTEFFSTVVADVLDPQRLDAAYWYRNLRLPVDFESTVQRMYQGGYRAFLEMSPHPVLTSAIIDALDEIDADADAVVVTGSLHRDEGGVDRLVTSMAEAFVRGVPMSWDQLVSSVGARVDLPTYPFQGNSLWLEISGWTDGDPATLGMAGVEHPLLNARVDLPGPGVTAFVTRLSLRSHPWLAEHAVVGKVVVPGAVLVELALHVGEQVGCPRVEELTVVTPMVIPERESLQMQVVVTDSPEAGKRALSIHSRPVPESGEAGDGLPWTLHAEGALASLPDTTVASTTAGMSVWPPVGADAVDLAGSYERVAELGYRYGPLFQGLRAVWKRGDEVFAEVSLPSDQDIDVSEFGLHPALLDAAIQACAALDAFLPKAGGAENLRLPFAWEGVTLYAVGATELRVRLASSGQDRVSLTLADTSGMVVATIESLVVLEVSREKLSGQAEVAHRSQDSMFGIDWLTVPLKGVKVPAQRAEWVVVGSCAGPDVEELIRSAAGVEIPRYATVADLIVDLDNGQAPPVAVLLPLGSADDQGQPTPTDVRTEVQRVLELGQAWLAERRLDASTLVALARHAVAIDGSEDVTDLGAAAALGLLRAANTENLGRVKFLDLGDEAPAIEMVAAALDSEEPELARRHGSFFARRLVRAEAEAAKVDLTRAEWQLAIREKGTLQDVEVIAADGGGATTALEPGQVRVALRAAGLNFRDVLLCLGMYPDEAATIGGDGAGVVLEVGSGVADFAPGDRVMGMFGVVGSTVIAEQRLLARIPDGWSFIQAASVPAAFLTAYYALHDLAGLAAGERVLIHAATGGVGSAAVQVARHLGAEVFGTASPHKWQALRDAGFSDDHMANSRNLDFEQKFLDVTGGAGMDVVLDCLSGEFVDASLRLLPRGGRFVEMGLIDIRRADTVAEKYRGVAYRSFVLFEAGLERLSEIFAELLPLFESGVFTPPAITVWDVRQAPEALRYLGQARHVGKVVLNWPAPFDPNGTVLISGGTGTIGGELARHLVTRHGARHLLLMSRRGPTAPGADRLERELEGLGASVTIAACDVADRPSLGQAIAAIDPDHPLTAVVHAAGALDDGLFANLTAEQIAIVLRAKVDAAWNLHELTGQADLSAFVLFSSAAGCFGAPGQANYAAANVFLDALSQHRRHHGRPAVSMAWGLWAQATGLTGSLTEQDLSRINRGGFRAMETHDALAMYDMALALGHPYALIAKMDMATLRAAAAVAELPPLLRTMLAARRRVDTRGFDASALTKKLVGLNEKEQYTVILDLIKSQIAAVLNYAGPEAVDADQKFMDMGFDSLSAVELRNRLKATAGGAKLSTTVIFDYPTPAQLAEYIRTQITPKEDELTEPILAEVDLLLDRLREIYPNKPVPEETLQRLTNSVAKMRGDGAEPPQIALEAGDLDAESGHHANGHTNGSSDADAADTELFAIVDGNGVD